MLADHAPDIVMFDVSPPERGVGGIDAYRETWPGFFQWQASGAVFDVESLDVVAGVDVAFAYALLRCGTPADFERDPDQRLRLTIGLRKMGERWVVAREHHSFSDKTEWATAPGAAAHMTAAVTVRFAEVAKRPGRVPADLGYRQRLSIRWTAERVPKRSKLSWRTSPFSEQMHSLLISGNETSSLGQPQWHGQPQIVTSSRCPSKPNVRAEPMCWQLRCWKIRQSSVHSRRASSGPFGMR